MIILIINQQNHRCGDNIEIFDVIDAGFAHGGAQVDPVAEAMLLRESLPTIVVVVDLHGKDLEVEIIGLLLVDIVQNRSLLLTVVAIGIPKPKDGVFGLYLVSGVLFTIDIVSGEFGDLRTGSELADAVHLPFDPPFPILGNPTAIVGVVNVQKHRLVVRVTGPVENIEEPTGNIAH